MRDKRSKDHSSATPRRRSIILWGALGGVVAVVLFLIPLHGPVWDLLSFQPEAAGISLLFSPIVALVGGILGTVGAAVSIRAIRRPWPQTWVSLGAGVVGGLVTAVGYFGWLIGSALPLVLILSVVGLALYLLSARKRSVLVIAGIVLASGAVLGLVWARQTEPVNGRHLTIQYQLGKRRYFGADLEGAQLSGTNLQGAYLNQANLSEADLSGADLRGAILTGANLSGADLAGASLERAYLDGAILDGANLTGANLEGALLFRSSIDSRTQLDAKPRLVWELVTQGGRNRDLSEADLSGATLIRVNLAGANLSRANLKGANLIEAYLSDADLRGANLDGAYLSDANLTRANLRGLDWEGAELRGADLSQADLSGANLTGADLGWTKLEGADLTGADLSGASLRQSGLSRANLRGATVTTEQLGEAFALTGAVMPDGTVHE